MDCTTQAGRIKVLHGPLLEFQPRVWLFQDAPLLAALRTQALFLFPADNWLWGARQKVVVVGQWHTLTHAFNACFIFF